MRSYSSNTMVRGRTRLAGLVPRLLYFYASISFVLCADHGIPIEIKLWDTGRTPLSHMVDVTNEFGLKVLAEHNFLNDNNIAFSPYGLMGILVALYEGVDGESSYQIQRGMQLPWNRNVMRIGFRDIHRTLKTYFVPEEGFLAGLALNNENVTFNDSYKKILRFYGFDLENDQMPTLPPVSNDAVNLTTTTDRSSQSTVADTTPTTVTTTDSVTGREDPSTMPTKEETTANPDAESITDIDIRGQTAESTTSSAASNAESTTPLATDITTFQSTTTGQTSTTETAAQAASTMEMSSMAPSTTTEVPTTITTTESTTESTPLETPPATSTTTTTEMMDDNNLSTRDMTSTSVSDTTPTDITESSTTMTTVPVTNTEGSSTITETSQTDTSTASNSEEPTTDSTTTSTLETLERRKRSLVVDYLFTKPPVIDDYLIYRSFDIPPEIGNIESTTDKMFLVNGLRNVQVTYMHYDTVLEHAYLPHLEASALRLPLDSDRYYLLVVLPSRDGAAELGRLLARMARESDLSDVYAALRPRRVRAIVPSFTVKGHVTLTTDLQKLGIRDVFEPRQHDFTPMTRQPGVYVRSIEQAVSVAIRKYQPDDQKKNRYVANRNRIFFSATYPFLYFVMDSNIHVALMAGKMVDPLNTRIL
ncbi:uncharacterized protein [Epargyreus clarus]|uniref:uncharacterized protein n=1 Tax=Epargyreus clarus TaxID=520877 RepID=UPI003C2E5C64